MTGSLNAAILVGFEEWVNTVNDRKLISECVSIKCDKRAEDT